MNGAATGAAHDPVIGTAGGRTPYSGGGFGVVPWGRSPSEVCQVVDFTENDYRWLSPVFGAMGTAWHMWPCHRGSATGSRARLTSILDGQPVSVRSLHSPFYR